MQCSSCLKLTVYKANIVTLPAGNVLKIEVYYITKNATPMRMCLLFIKVVRVETLRYANENTETKLVGRGTSFPVEAYVQ